jgi:hypothetical protein
MDAMDDTELNALRRRFGDAIEDWPAPHRREALDHLSGRAGALHDAVMQPTDEAALSQAVLTRLAGPQRRMAWDPRSLIVGYAALLIGFGMAGYFGTGILTDDPIAAAALAGLL